MIASLEKNADLVAYWDMMDILETMVNSYRATENKELLIPIQAHDESCNRLKLKLETHDYAEDDARRARVDQILKRYDKN